MALRGKVLGLVGFGAIAKQVAKRAIAFGMQVFASDPLLTDTIAKEHGIESVSLDSLWPVADFVSVHCPLTASTRNIIDGAAIARMKRGVVVINNGRGGLLDEEALYAALVDKHVAYAALDVLAKEPPASDYALLALPNVLVTPHIASVSETSVDRLQQMAVDEVVRVLGGQPALNPIR
jgi:phosphoglycerate dehydrogenase-like enzyme